MKKILILSLSLLFLVVSAATTVAASSDSIAASGAVASCDEVGTAAYSIVSVVVNESYDFKKDFHDSLLVDDDYATEGVFRMSDSSPDVTLTLKNNSTGEVFVYNKNAETDWYLTSSVDHLLYDTTQIGAVLNIIDLGGSYGIKNTSAPADITVVSSLYSADFHKYPTYKATAFLSEGKDYSLDYDASVAKDKAVFTILNMPKTFYIDIYNVETGEMDTYDQDNGEFVYDKVVDVNFYDPSARTFWVHIPAKLIMEDGYEFEFTLSIWAFPKSRSDNNKTDTDTSDDKTDGDNTENPSDDKKSETDPTDTDTKDDEDDSLSGKKSDQASTGGATKDDDDADASDNGGSANGSPDEDTLGNNNSQLSAEDGKDETGDITNVRSKPESGIPISKTNDLSTSDSAPSTRDSVNPSSGNDNGAIQTGDRFAAYFLSFMILVAAAGVIWYGRRQKTKDKIE